MPLATGPDQFIGVYRRVVESFPAYGGVLAASYELIAQADDNDQIRAHLREAVKLGPPAPGPPGLGLDSRRQPERAAMVGTAFYPLLSRLIVS